MQVPALMAQQGIEEDLLQRWFPLEADDKLTPFSEKDIRGIADVLIRCSRERWSRVPRLYSILKKIGQLDAIDAFIDNDLSDLSFPFSKSTLPEALREISARVKFIELQHLVYNSEALNLEQATHHGHFNDSADVPLKKVGDLGKGGYGYVDRVVSTISHREYARKQIPRGTTFRRDRQVLKDFTRELSNLRRLSHRHLVELVGSYTDKRFVAILMLPVADVNLQTFLDNTHLNERSRSLLRPFFGCLASALSYLHDNRIRHKDIKPSNVLIKDDQVYFTDFGTSLDWSGRDHSATATAPPTTPRYCAPEVMAFTERNSSSDIWSFGCVLLEMWSVLKHGTITDLKAHMVTTGTKTTSYHSNLEAIDSWVQFLRSSPGPSSDLIPSTWITNMLRHEPASRWNIHKLGNEISEACMDSSTQHSFKGICCLDLEDETSDDMESIHSDHHDHLAVPSQSQPNPSFLAKNVDVQKLGIISIQQVEHSSSDNHNIIGTEKHGIQNKIRTGDKNTSMVQKIPGRCTPQSNHRSTNMIYKQNFTDNDEMNVRPTLGKERRDSVNRIDTDSRKLKLQDNSGVEETTDTLDGSWQPLHPKQKVKTRLFGALSDSRYADYIPYIPPLRPTRRARPIYDEDEGSDTSNKAVTGIQPTVKPETHRTVSVLHSMNGSEQQAVYNFEIHAGACHSCRTPWLTYTQGTAFCSTGYRLALRLLGFMCRVDGVVYSTSYKDHVATQVSISTDYSCTHELFRAISAAREVAHTHNIKAFWFLMIMCGICRMPLSEHGVRVGSWICRHKVHKACSDADIRHECFICQHSGRGTSKASNETSESLRKTRPALPLSSSPQQGISRNRPAKLRDDSGANTQFQAPLLVAPYQPLENSTSRRLSSRMQDTRKQYLDAKTRPVSKSNNPRHLEPSAQILVPDYHARKDRPETQFIMWGG